MAPHRLNKTIGVQVPNGTAAVSDCGRPMAKAGHWSSLREGGAADLIQVASQKTYEARSVPAPACNRVAGLSRARKNGCGILRGAAFLRVKEEMMKTSTKLTLSLIALAAAAALLGGLYLATRPAPAEGTKTIEVVVVHGDKREASFRYETQEEYLGSLLQKEGLIRGEDGPYGLYITEVDGEAADHSTNGAYWALYEGGEYAAQGIDATVLEDGDHFSLVYTVA